MKKLELASQIYNISHLTGKFKLRSGQLSNEYFDKYLFESNPEILRGIANFMSELIPEDAEILAGLEMGGIPIATALSLSTGLPTVMVRKKAKEYGTCKLAEGIEIKGKHLCIVEDVVTTGGQIIESAAELRGLGAIIDSVICVIERDKRAKDNLKKEGLNLISLFTYKDLNKII